MDEDFNPLATRPPAVLEIGPAHLAQLLAGNAVRVRSTWVRPSHALALLCQSSRDLQDDFGSPVVLPIASPKKAGNSSPVVITRNRS